MSSSPKHNLVALSSAAIIAVYAAGFVRTKAAAAKIAEREERRPPVRATTPRARQEPGVREQAVGAGHLALGATERSPEKQTRTAKQKRRDTSVVVAATSVPAPAPQVPSVAPATAENGAPPAAPAAPVDSAKHADSAKVVWKDGYYFGWGTSRHGDIQAGVEIKDGRIVSALITQCLTRYSCSWIDALQGQVVARQSPEVDFISGATQSTNAFYYAVVEALSKAR